MILSRISGTGAVIFSPGNSDAEMCTRNVIQQPLREREGLCVKELAMSNRKWARRGKKGRNSMLVSASPYLFPSSTELG